MGKEILVCDVDLELCKHIHMKVREVLALIMYLFNMFVKHYSFDIFTAFILLWKPILNGEKALIAGVSYINSHMEGYSG